MRIMMLSWEYPPRVVGGIAKVVHDLSHVFANQGHEVHVITYKEGNTKEFEKDGEVFVHRVSNYPINANNLVDWVMQLNFCMIEKAADVIKEFGKFDIVHAHDWLVAYAARAIKNSYKVPMVATIHATESGRNKGIHDSTQGYVNDVEWMLTYEASNVICNSEYMKNEIRNLFGKPSENINVVSNGIDIHKFDNQERDWNFRRNYAADNEKIVFFAGRLTFEKGIQVLLDAAPKILQNYNDVKFVIAGRGYYLDDLKRQADRLGISNRVYFTGFLNGDQMVKMYKSADIAVFPSLYEPFGIVALEGMLSGATTIVSDTGGLNEIVSHGIDGLKFYTGNSNSLADSILEALFNPTLCKEIAKNAKEKVCTEYNWQVIGKNTMEVYKDTIKLAKASQVKFEFKEEADEVVKEVVKTHAPLFADSNDNTITTDTSDKDISGILPNPFRKLAKDM